jgi:uncharacterized membrane protein YfcA
MAYLGSNFFCANNKGVLTGPQPPPPIASKNPATMIPQGAVAGFLDAIGGGGWGPVNTPLLLAQKKFLVESWRNARSSKDL